MSATSRYQNSFLECNTSKFKLEESQYFLKRMADPKIWNSDTFFDFYLNVFVTSSDSVT